MPADVVMAHTAVLVRPMTYRLSRTFAGSMSGSSGRFARVGFIAQKNSNVSAQSVPAAVFVLSRSCWISGESALGAFCASAVEATSKNAMTVLLMAEDITTTSGVYLIRIVD